MKLSISNIGWAKDDDIRVYGWMKEYGYSGLEIAPTRIFPDNPYSRLENAIRWAENLKSEYGFSIPSIQSIWCGRQEKIFGSEEERKKLVDYTKCAIDFAEAIGCRNLVFGCPGNRNVPDGADGSIGVEFFREIGNYAAAHHTVVAMEGNPPVYNTNYINDTASAIELIGLVNSPGFRLNLDVGTMVENGETADGLSGKVNLINHVHISEPELKTVVQRNLHRELKNLLLQEEYQGFVSIEMAKTDNVNSVQHALKYIKEIFQ